MIIISKNITAFNGINVSYHKVEEIKVSPNMEDLNLLVLSWASEAQYLNETDPLARWMVRVPILSLLNSSALVGDIATLLISSGDLSGGILVPGTDNTLASAKAKKWTEVKQWRANEIDTPLTTPYGILQCAAEDRQNITDAVLLAQTLSGLQQTVAIPWTLADNTISIFDADKMVTVGLLLGQKTQAAHARARLRRAEIDAATTITEVDAVVW